MEATTDHEKATPTKLEGKFTAMVVCWLLGIGCLFSWNSMLTIQDYYVTLFPNYHPSRILTLVYQPFALGTLAILTYYEATINTRKRNLFGYILFFFSTLAVLILDLATSGKGGIGSFIGVCAISGAFGVADAYAQGGMIGDLSFMLPEFIQSFVAGLAASGAITSGLRMVTKGVFDNSQNGLRKGALLFFALCTIFELLCVLLYAFVFPKLPIVKYYRSKAASEGSKTVSADLAAGGIYSLSGEEDTNSTKQERLSNKELLRQNIDYAMDMFLIYLLTLFIFPGFLSEDTGSHSLGSWYVLVIIAMYNVWDLVGRYIPLIKCVKLESRKGLMIAVLARFLLIPAFYFTTNYADQGWMIFLTSFLGISNGYLTVCVLTSAPKGYKGPEQNALGNILVLFLMGGLFAGVTSDWLWLIGKDGSIPGIKVNTYRQRLHLDNEGRDESYLNKTIPLQRNMGSKFSCMIKEAKILASELGVPCLDGIEEGEAHCALLGLKESLCDGCFLLDSDIFLFRARTTYRDICLGKVVMLFVIKWMTMRQNLD